MNLLDVLIYKLFYKIASFIKTPVVSLSSADDGHSAHRSSFATGQNFCIPTYGVCKSYSAPIGLNLLASKSDLIAILRAGTVENENLNGGFGRVSGYSHKTNKIFVDVVGVDGKGKGRFGC